MIPDIPADNPRTFENPIGAGIELAELTEKWLPRIRRRSAALELFSIIWAALLLSLSLVATLIFLDFLNEPTIWWVLLQPVILLIVTVPSASIGLGLAVLAWQERRFLPYLAASSEAMGALVSKPTDEGSPDGAVRQEDPLASILNSAFRIGGIVTLVGRMATIAQALLVSVLVGLAYLIAAFAGYVVVWPVQNLLFILEAIVLGGFALPGLVLMKMVSRDRKFYDYYTRRHRALSEVASMGVPPVPEGETHAERFDTFARRLPAIAMMIAGGGSFEKDVRWKNTRYCLLYRGGPDGGTDDVLVTEVGKIPPVKELDAMLENAREFGRHGKLRLSRLVVLSRSGDEGLDDGIYDYIVELGKKTAPDGCVLQLAMEVDGAYSLVPYVA